MDNCGNSRANTCLQTRPREGLCVLETGLTRSGGRTLIHNTPTNRIGDESFKFLTYQLSMVGYWPTMALTGNGELGFNSGEGARETATTSKEGSRRVNYPILIQGGSDKKYQYEASLLCNWNENNLNLLTSIHWRASLVPAAAVIPAPIAYIKIVAVKTLVVGYL